MLKFAEFGNSKKKKVSARNCAQGGAREKKIGFDISVELSGDVATAVAGVDTGSIGAKVWWRDGQLVVNDFAWDSPGIKLTGNATVTPATEEGGVMAVAANIPEARVTGTGLQMLLGLIPISGASLRSGSESHIAVTDFLLGAECLRRTPIALEAQKKTSML